MIASKRTPPATMRLATPKRFTLTEYHRLSELGFFSEDDRIELIHGEIVQMASKGTPHAVCSTLLNRELIRLLGERATLRGRGPITLPPNSEPEPDFAIVRNQADDYLSSHPTSADVLLVIEIADSSLSYDQQTKLALYAEAGIIDYWIFNLPSQQLETYREPYQDSQNQFGYRSKRIYLLSETVTLPPFPDLMLDLAKAFPSQPSQAQ